MVVNFWAEMQVLNHDKVNFSQYPCWFCTKTFNIARTFSPLQWLIRTLATVFHTKLSDEEGETFKYFLITTIWWFMCAMCNDVDDNHWLLPEFVRFKPYSVYVTYHMGFEGTSMLLIHIHRIPTKKETRVDKKLRYYSEIISHAYIRNWLPN